MEGKERRNARKGREGSKDEGGFLSFIILCLISFIHLFVYSFIHVLNRRHSGRVRPVHAKSRQQSRMHPPPSSLGTTTTRTPRPDDAAPLLPPSLVLLPPWFNLPPLLLQCGQDGEGARECLCRDGGRKGVGETNDACGGK